MLRFRGLRRRRRRPRRQCTNTRGTEGERSEYKSLSWTGGGGREGEEDCGGFSQRASFFTFFVLWIAAYAQVSFPRFSPAEVIWPAVD